MEAGRPGGAKGPALTRVPSMRMELLQGAGGDAENS